MIDKVFETVLDLLLAPSRQSKKGRCPDFNQVARKVVRGGILSKKSGILLASIARITMVAWTLWGLCLVALAVAVGLALYHFGWEPKSSEPIVLGLCCKKLIACTCAILFLLTVTYMGCLALCRSLATASIAQIELDQRLSSIGKPQHLFSIDNKAFVGVSLDGKDFTRTWVAATLTYILERHETVLLLVADHLFTYTRSWHAQGTGSPLNYASGIARARVRSDEFDRFLMSVIDALPEVDQKRVAIRRWSDFCDEHFVLIWRRLQIAFYAIEPFRAAVTRDARSHSGGAVESSSNECVHELNAAYILEEVAMCLRVAEVGGFYSEYYPKAQLRVLAELYSGDFEGEGLSVRSLTEQQPRRTFQALTDL